MTGESLAGAVPPKIRWACAVVGGDLGYFSRATFWLLADLVLKKDSESSFLGELQAQR